jgi:glutamate/tyrosine decarboxylase-like PLP-dependent enzyme
MGLGQPLGAFDVRGKFVKPLRLLDRGLDATVASGGPRCFHFVIGGSTPAALGADWLASALDQVAYAWVSSPLGVELERLSIDWLKELFGLPAGWGGLMTTGATMANFVGLAAARQWCGERRGVDLSEEGLFDQPTIPVFSSGYLHASTRKVLSLLGFGRRSVRICSSDDRGSLDVGLLRESLRTLDGAPAILVANAGEVNAGDFDPVEVLADLAQEFGAWLHVDGAFGLFAAVSPRTRHLVQGVERAQSVTVDGHKWLNVPYDCGFSFVREARLSNRAFAYVGDYLPKENDPRANFGILGPESSRRSRAMAVWSTLRAYGRDGYRRMVEGHLDLAHHLAGLIDAAPDLERLAEVPLCIVCFRYRPEGWPDGGRADELDALNTKLGDALKEDGRFWVGTTLYRGRVAFRPALVNWRIRERDLQEFVAVVREVGARVAEGYA